MLVNPDAMGCLTPLRAQEALAFAATKAIQQPADCKTADAGQDRGSEVMTQATNSGITAAQKQLQPEGEESLVVQALVKQIFETVLKPLREAEVKAFVAQLFRDALAPEGGWLCIQHGLACSCPYFYTTGGHFNRHPFRRHCKRLRPPPSLS